MSRGTKLQKMEEEVKQSKTAVNANAKPGEPMPKGPQGSTPQGLVPIEDLGGPTPENYKVDDDSAKLKTPGGTLKQVINKTAFAVSRDDLKPALTGVLFKFSQNNITTVATDGHRLVKYENTNTTVTDQAEDVIVPKKFLNLLSGSLGDEKIKLSVGENHLTTTVGSDQYFTRIIDEKFPDFDGVIPKDNDKNFNVDRNLLLSAVKRVSIFSNKSTHQIALQLNNKQASVSTEDPEQSTKASEEIKGNYQGDDITVGYNAAYLKDVLSHINSDEVVVQLKSPISAALFLPKEQEKNSNLTMLLMPIRLND